MNEEILINYKYDIGYYEGVRNTLQIIHQTLRTPTKTETDRISLLLFEIRKELDDAQKMHKESKKLFYDEMEY